MEAVGGRLSSKRRFLKRIKSKKSELSSEPMDIVPPPLRRSSRISHPSEMYLGILTEDLEEAFLVGYKDIRNDLKTYNEIILDIDSEKWMEVMKSEIDSIHSNQIWS